MKKNNLGISAIVPAYNEEKTIADILKVLTKSLLINEIVVVNDGSTDKTAQIVHEFDHNIRLFNSKNNKGKGWALHKGAKVAKNQILFFCDADLSGLKQKHLRQLIEPVREKRFEMVVGVQEKMLFLYKYSWFQKLFPTNKNKTKFCQGLGGEKVLWKKDFLRIKNIKNSGYGIEQIIMNYFVKNNKSYKNISLHGVGHVWKLDKWGFRGFLKEIGAYAVFAKQYLKFEIFRRH